MSGFIQRAFINEVINRTDIVDIIEARVDLKKQSKDYAACCPFHQEKTPSFTVSPKKQFYHCFGCGAHGNVISFLMDFDKLEFVDAIEVLANHLGLEVAYEDGSPPQLDHSDLYNLMAKICHQYRAELRRAPAALDYLKSRGLNKEIINRYQIGFAPQGWHFCEGLAANPNDLITTGMSIRNDDGKIYDRFRQRIMFPIRDRRGRVIGFGGRAIGDDNPKYLNSPETTLFHKGSELFGLYEAKQSGKLEKLIIVEGYMDVVALAQFGINYAVATLGTATTDKHLQLLFRVCKQIVFCFDGDQAGAKAAWRALETALPLMRSGLQLNFMFLPQAHDPDSFIRENGKAAFITEMENASTLSNYFFQHLSADIDLEQIDGKARLGELANQYIEKMPSGLFQELMYDKLAKIIGVDAERIKPSNNSAEPEVVKYKKPTRARKNRPSPVRLAITLLLQNPELAQEIDDVESLNNISLPGIEILQTLLMLIKQNPNITTGAVLENWREHKQMSKLSQLASQTLIIPQEGMKAEFIGAINAVNTTSRDVLIQRLMQKASQQGINATEKQQLQDLLAAKGKTVV